MLLRTLQCNCILQHELFGGRHFLTVKYFKNSNAKKICILIFHHANAFYRQCMAAKRDVMLRLQNMQLHVYARAYCRYCSAFIFPVMWKHFFSHCNLKRSHSPSPRHMERVKAGVSTEAVPSKYTA